MAKVCVKISLLPQDETRRRVTVAAAIEGTVVPDHHGKKNAVGSGTATSGTLLAIPLGPRISLESTIMIRLGRQSYPDTRRNPDEGGL